MRCRVPTKKFFEILSELYNILGWHFVNDCIDDINCVKKLADLIDESVCIEILEQKNSRYEYLHLQALNEISDLIK